MGQEWGPLITTFQKYWHSAGILFSLQFDKPLKDKETLCKTWNGMEWRRFFFRKSQIFYVTTEEIKICFYRMIAIKTVHFDISITSMIILSLFNSIRFHFIPFQSIPCFTQCQKSRNMDIIFFFLAEEGLSLGLISTLHSVMAWLR